MSITLTMLALGSTMKTSMRTVEREFSPGEIEKITGVNGALQRDWRRRKILPENPSGKWTRFSLTDAIRIFVLKTFADAGGSVSYISDVAEVAVLPTLAIIAEIPGAYVFDGDEISDNLKRMVVTGSIVGARGRYLVMIANTNGDPSIVRCDELTNVDAILAETGAAHCTLIDCFYLAQIIAERAGLPLIRVEVENIDDE